MGACGHVLSDDDYGMASGGGQAGLNRPSVFATLHGLPGKMAGQTCVELIVKPRAWADEDQDD